MPKRTRTTQDAGDKTKPPARRNTERSHSENQERAYIAASRRADRSIEARVQSARNASDIHKKRTGKAFRITEEIVMKEEMYEEEDDDFPRSYRLLNPRMQTANSELNTRVEAYLTNRVAMSKLLSATDADWRNNEVNQTFAQIFPEASRRVRSVPQPPWSNPNFSLQQTPGSMAGTRTPHTGDQSFNTQFQPVNYGQGHNERRQSMAGLSSTAGLSPTDARNDGPISPPALTPGSMSHPETPRSRVGSTFGTAQSHGAMMGFNSENSAFTSQLPAEARMLMGGVGLGGYSTSIYNDPQWQAQTFGLDGGADPTNQYFGYTADVKPPKEGEAEGEQYPDPFADMGWGSQGEPGAPTKNAAEDWEAYINENVWNNDQQ
ncbi:hypothetical protein ACHAPT_003770 [Fusarium lateritium]